MAYFANIIVDISLDKLDRPFVYQIPEDLLPSIFPGVQVNVPFGNGNRTITGYVIEITKQPNFDSAKIKEITSVVNESVPIESQLISLAFWMKRHYGSTMNQSLKTVLPVKQQKAKLSKRTLHLLLSKEEAQEKLTFFLAKNQKARYKLLEALIADPVLFYDIVIGKLNIARTTIRYFEENNIVQVNSQSEYRNPISHLVQKGYDKTLNVDQQKAVDQVMRDVHQNKYLTYLLFGVTGSGKTEVYMELIAHMIEEKKQAIVLIPEIALTFQTVMRFFNRFGNRVSIMNSKLSASEKYDQFERAKKGEIDIVIGPRSALFTPFLKLGLIIIDEEHESTYKSEPLPRYHAREVAIERARMCNAVVILGSATPSLDSFYKAKKKEYELIELKKRVEERPLPFCHVIDLRQELKAGNFSMISRKLEELMREKLDKKEQIMLFINRRGIAGFVSCRACGHVMKCEHCDVSLSQHNNGKLLCHYCGHQETTPRNCPNCGSTYISGFKSGTQKIETMVKEKFAKAKVLRMDYDTTRTKESYEKILSAFANQEADILIGTQMIVKGHDFSKVTLVGILAADMSLYVEDYRAAERTFQLLTQAAGRAGRGEQLGEVVIQTYTPDHYSIIAAKNQDYEGFYQEEMIYRSMLAYPPASHLLSILISGKSKESTDAAATYICTILQKKCKSLIENRSLSLIGPSDPSIAKMNDIYRKVIYLKQENYNNLILIKDYLEEVFAQKKMNAINILFDFDPMHGY